MARITQGDRYRIERTLVEMHSHRINERKARALVAERSVQYLPKKLRAVVAAGYGPHLKQQLHVVVGRTTAYVYDATDVVALAADAELRSAVLRLVHPDVNTGRYRHPIVQRFVGLDTYPKLLAAYPELTELCAWVKHEGPEPDLAKLRRKLLRAGWPLTAKASKSEKKRLTSVSRL